MFCRTCRGPAPDGFARCYQCDLAAGQAGELLADAVEPLGYAVRGGALARDLWRYKSDHAGAAESAARLREMLAAFLRDRADEVWAAAGMPAGPAMAAVVPTGQGRPGAHPLLAVVRSCVHLPLAGLSVAANVAHARGVTLGWLRVDGPVGGKDVLVIDDTWVSGGSAQSAAAALKLAGARRVAIVVLRRHVNPADPRSAGFLASLAG
jgi:adenine/guanine phosphoribosyltransferase-like PRPP-binding protein